MQTGLRKYDHPTIFFTLFRVAFGLMMIPQITHLMPFIYELREYSVIIPYPALEFIKPYSFSLIVTLHYLSISGALLLALGLFPRLGAFIFLISFGYLFLLDQSFYNNHYYLWCLLAFLFAITDTHKSYSIVSIIRGKIPDQSISTDTFFGFKSLIAIVYIYAAWAKINPDWLQGYPATLWFESKGITNAHVMGLLMSYGGLLFDLSIAFFLWAFPRRVWVIFPYLTFHVLNSLFFKIGVFPYVMIAAWLLFAAPVKHHSTFSSYNPMLRLGQVQRAVLTSFLVFNILFPLRYIMYEGRTSWHRQGYYFSWRMMLDSYRMEEFSYYVKLPESEIAYHVDFSKLMTYRQFMNTYHDAYALWYVAQQLKLDAMTKYQEPHPQVYSRSLVALNQHLPKYIVDPNIDLASERYQLFRSNKFINI